MREPLIFLLLFVYYLLLGIICYYYFKFIKKKTKGNIISYILLYGMRIRIGFSGILALITADLILYGTIIIK
jgi:hypothetical protein